MISDRYHNKDSKKINMRIIFILIVLITFCLKSNAQELESTVNFYHSIYQADLQAKQGNFEEAILIFEESFEKVDYVQTFLLRKVLNFAKQNNDKNRANIYRELIKKQEKCPEGNRGLLAKIDSVFKLDQKYIASKYQRASVYYANCKNNNDFEVSSDKCLKSKKLVEESTEVLSSNIEFLLNLMEEHGYISEKMIGSKNHYNFHVQLLHFDRDTNNLVLGPILFEALKNNQISPLTYAVTIDRHLYSTTGTQKYWTSAFQTHNPNLTEKEVQEVLQLREDIGIFGSSFNFKLVRNKEWKVVNTYGSYY